MMVVSVITGTVVASEKEIDIDVVPVFVAGTVANVVSVLVVVDVVVQVRRLGRIVTVASFGDLKTSPELSSSIIITVVLSGRQLAKGITLKKLFKIY
jgi:hypothetical protein